MNAEILFTKILNTITKYHEKFIVPCDIHSIRLQHGLSLVIAVAKTIQT